MKKNKKMLFLAVALVTVLILVTSVNAATDNINASTTHSISEKTTTAEPVVKEKIEKSATKELKTDKTQDKTITKTNKTKENKKKDSITIDGITYNNIIENQEYKGDLVDENTFFNNCTITSGYFEIYSDIYINNSIVNLEYVQAYCEQITINNSIFNDEIEGSWEGPSFIISNSTITANTYIYTQGNNKITTSILNNTLYLSENTETTFSDDTIFGENFELQGKGSYIINDTSRITPHIYEFHGNTTLTNYNLSRKITNSGNLTFISSILNSTISNSGIVYISDDTIIGENFKVNNFGTAQVIYLAPNPYDGNNEINNENIIKDITIPTTGNITLTNCQINAKITNNGNLTLINCSLSNNNIIDSLIENKGNLVMNNSIVENNTGNGVVINSTGDLIFINSNVFNNTCAVISVPTTTETISVDVRNNSFINNRGVVSLGKSFNSVVNIEENTFTNSSIDSMFNQTNIDDNVFVNSSINIDNYNVKANNRISSNTFNNTYVASPFLKAYNNTFNGGSLGTTEIDDAQFGTNYLEVYDNNFNNAILTLYCASQDPTAYFGDWAREGSEINNTIYNNVFKGQTSVEDVITLIYPEYNNFTKIFNNTYIKTSINDKIIYEISPKLYENDTITFNYQVNNPKNYDPDITEKTVYTIYVDDVLYKNNTTDNTIQLNSKGEHTITITTSTSTTTFTKIVDVLPLSDVIITPENLNRYLDNGVLTRVNEEDRVLFQGEFNNLGEIFIDTDDIVIDGQNAHFTNTTFTLEAQNIIIQNMNIENTNNTKPVISNTKRNNYILNNNITLINTEGKTTAIKNNAANTQIRNNIIYVDGPSIDIAHSTGGSANTQAILLTSANKNTVQNNTITVTTTQESEQFGTIEGITATGVTNTIITQNRVNVSNAKFSYGIDMLASVTDNSITENNITVTSYRYCDGIQVGNNAENILIDKNQINIYCHNTTPVDEEAISYGIITTNMGQGTSTEIYIYNNNITIDSTVGYGIEIYETTNTEIRNNTILVTGTYSMGIGYAHSPTSTVQGNNIYCIGDSTQIGSVTEEIQPSNTGIQIQQNSNNIKIEDGYVWGYKPLGANTIHTNDKGGQDWCVNVENSTQVQVVGNNMVCSNGKADYAIKNNTELIPNYDRSNFVGIIYTNIYINMPTETIIETTIPIEISITDEYGKTIVGGGDVPLDNTITLTINDQNITFTIKDETYTYNYTPNNTGTIQVTATYDGFDILYYNATTTTKTLTVNPKPVSHTNTTTENLTLGNSTTLTATFIDDNDQLITSGKVIFKVNGKTIRDNNGNVIYAEIVDGQATLPDVNITQEWMKPGTTIQAVYMGDNNNEPIITEKTPVTVTKPEAKITLEAPKEATAGTKITLKANVTDGNTPLNSGRVAFKLNGKTLKNAEGQTLYANVENGEATITYTIPEKTKAKEYVLTAVFTDTKYDRKDTNSTLTVVKA